jgi:CHAT domain-containing protein
VMTHPIARCVGDSQGSLRYRLPAGRIATIAPNYLKANDRLERAQVETKMLQDRYSAVSVNGIRNDVWGLFANGLDHDFVSIVHFAGHGDFPLDDPGQSLLKLQDGDLTAREVDTSEVKLGKRSGCLVFFNACKTGSTGGLLGGVGGWAEIILRRRFGGFIAPLWAVDDDDAAAVSASLFDDLLNRKVPVSQALLSIRKKFGKRSPTYLAYLFYGDVGAKIQ